jgi:hypothetical protein
VCNSELGYCYSYRSGMVAVLGPFEALPCYIHTYIHTVIVCVLKAVARRRLRENRGNPSALATASCVKCKSTIELYGLYFIVTKCASVTHC